MTSQYPIEELKKIPHQSTNWTNWSGNVQSKPTIYSPKDEEGIQLLIEYAVENGKTIRVKGSSHSFSPIVKTDGIMVSLENLTGLIEIHQEEKLATFWGGTSIKQVAEILGDYNFALENQGDIDKQTIAGAISTGTHGTGKEYGNLATQVKSIRLIPPSGKPLTINSDEQTEIFHAVGISLGSCGIISQVTLRMEERIVLEAKRSKETLDEVIDRIPELHQEYRHFEFYCFPYTETVQLKTMQKTNQPPKSSRIMRFINDIILENWGLGLLLGIAKYFKSTAPRISKIIATLVSDDVEVNYSNRVYATARLVKFNEMEYAVPAEKGPECLKEILELIEEEEIKVAFPIEYRYVRGDNFFLSPMYERDSVTISIHLNKGMDYERYFKSCEQIFRSYNGRPHWGKIHFLGANELKKLYPKWEEFEEIRERFDPKKIMWNEHLEKLFCTSKQ